ncbi:MAG: hypothetical protein ABL909_09720 [Sphingopyxis sp.]
MAMIGWLRNSATPLRLLIVAIVMNALRYGVMPRMGAEVMNTPGAGPLDLMFAYSPAEAFATIGAFSDAGRSAYRLFLLSADVAYPISYLLFFAWSIALLQRSTRWAAAHWPLVPPLALFGFDMAENAGIVTMLSLYPEQPWTIALITSICTTLKWIFAGMSFLVILWLGAVRLIEAWRARRT